MDRSCTALRQSLRHHGTDANQLDAATLESRVVYSAAPALEATEGFEVDTILNSWGAEPAQLLFIDETLDDIDLLIRDATEHLPLDANLQVHLLDTDQDGIDQIGDVIDLYSQVSAIHVLSHGDNGVLQLGDQALTTANIHDRSADLAAWNGSLTANADILLYGCRVASGHAGESLINTLGELTGADIAASSNDTGHASLSADWELEYSIGSIENDVVVSEAAQAAWFSTLANITVSQTMDVVNGDVSSVAALTGGGDGGDGISLREAILAVNNDVGGDTILLGSGTYTLNSGPGTDDDHGDLDIRNDVDIVGGSAANTIIDANLVDRAFEIHNDSAITVNIIGLKIENGQTDVGETQGGALKIDGSVANRPIVTLTDLWLTGNRATGSGSAGGAIYNEANLQIVNSLLENNDAESGGGIANANGATLALTNVTISGNSASVGAGGGISNSASATLQHVTIANNSAGTAGGGIHNDDSAGAATSINDVLVAANTATSNNDLDGTFVSDTGDNLIRSPGTAAGLHPMDRLGIDPLLEALNANGHPVMTHALGAGSPAIDAGGSPGVVTTDQRGVVRGTSADIGAFEFTSAVGFSTEGESRGSQNSIALDDFGNYVTVWSADGLDGDGWGVFARRYDVDGNALTDEIRINETTPGNQQWARVASDSAGNFVVVWTSDQNGDSDVFLRRFDASGINLSAEILVNDTTSGEQKDAVVDMDAATGEFVVTWEGNGPSDADGIFFRRFDATANALDATDQLANLTDRGVEHDPVVAMLTGGKFVIGWDAGQHIYFERFAATGTPENDERQIDGGLSTSSGLAVDSGPSGNFTFVYREEGFLTGVWGRGYNEDGTENYGWFRAGNSDGVSPSISMADDGSFVVVWHETTDADGTAINGRKYSATGSDLGPEFQINLDENGNQKDASVAIVDTNNFHVIWSGDGPAEATGPVVRSFSAGDANHRLWLATDGDVPTSDSPGLAAWESGNVLEFGDPAFALGATTSGEFSIAIDFDALAADGDVDVDGIHFVSRNILVGTTNPIQLLAGDVLFSTDNDETFSGTVALQENIMVFRPNTLGDYSSGTFSLFSNGEASGSTETRDFALVESVTTVGDATLQPGTLIYNSASSGDLHHWIPDDPAAGTPFSSTRLIALDSINAAGNSVFGVELIETDRTVAGVNLAAGTLLVSLQADGNLGDNSLATTAQDIVTLDVTTTGAATSATASLLLDGSAVGLMDAAEAIFPFAMLSRNVAPELDNSHSPEFTSIPKNGFTPAGDTIASIVVDGSITDADGLDLESIAVLGADDSNGTWQYSLDDGTNWSSINDGSLAESHALLLDATADGALTQRIRFVPNPSFEGTSTITFRAWDMTSGAASGSYADTSSPGGASAYSVATDTARITVFDANPNSPVADDESFTVAEGSTATESDLDTGVNLLDGDTDADLPGDALQVNTTPVVGPTHGVLSLNTDGTFSYAHDGSENFSDSFVYEVSDSGGNTDNGTVTITITPTNDNTPAADAESFTVAEGGTATEADLDAGVNLLDGDTDLDLPNDTLTVNTTPVTAPTHGSLTLNANGTFSYTHDGSENFSDSFVYEVSDALGNTDTATVTITVTPANDNTPTADAESFTVAEGGTATEADLDAGVNLLDGDTDPDLPGDTLLVNTTPVTAPTHGSLTLNANGTFSYTHDGSENFSDSFVYEVSDALGNTDTATVTITVTPANDNTPTADAESFTVAEGGTATEADLDAGVNLLDGDTDQDLPNDTLTVNTTPVTGPTHGSLTLNANGTFSYTHDGSENFSDSFVYEVSDALGNTDTATVTITVTPANDNTPTADAESFTVAEGGTATEADLDAGVNLLDGDTDLDLPNDTLSVNTTPVTGSTHGSLTLNANGTFSYTHDGSENFSDSFVYEVSDALGNTDTATVTITVTPANDNTPTADAESFTVAEGGTATEADLDAGVNLLDGDTDQDLPNDTLTVNTTPVTGPTHGSLTLNANGTFSYTHDGSENFSDSFVYEVSDALGNTDTATVTITVTPANDNTPTADAESFTVAEGGTATEADLDAGVNLLDGDTDLDLPNDTLSVNTTPVTGSTHGSLTLNANGTFSYTHDGSENFSDSFVYEVSDALGNTDTATVTITVTPANDNTPTADAESFTVAEGGTATETDLDAGVNLLDGDTDLDLPNDALTVNTTPVTAPTHGSLTLNANGTFSYTHDGSENFSDSFVYEVSDALGNTDTATVTITVTPANDNVPTADAESFSLGVGATATEANLDAGTSLLDGDNDLDLPNDLLTVDATPVVAPAHGTLVLNTDGSFSYTHNGSSNFNDSFTYRVRDSAANTATGTVSITVLPPIGAPTAILPGSIDLVENTDTTGGIVIATLSATDPDPSDTFTYAIQPGLDAVRFSLGGAAGDTLILDAGLLDFEATSSFSVVVRVTDSMLNTLDQSIVVNVVDVDESPVARDDTFVGSADSTVVSSAGVLVNDFDPEGSPVFVTLVSTTSSGVLSLNVDGSFTYQPNPGFSGIDTFTYRIDDGSSTPAQAIASINVLLPPPPPAPSQTSGELTDIPVPGTGNDSSTTPTQPGADLPPAIPAAAGEEKRPDYRSRRNLDTELMVSIQDELEVTTKRKSVAKRPYAAAYIASTESNREPTPYRESTSDVHFSDGMISGFNDLRNEVSQEQLFVQAMIGTSLVATTSLSIGYVVWIIRGGVLISSLLSSLPAWHLVDPLPVLGTNVEQDEEEENEDEDDSLESLVSHAKPEVEAVGV